MNCKLKWKIKFIPKRIHVSRFDWIINSLCRSHWRTGEKERRELYKITSKEAVNGI